MSCGVRLRHRPGALDGALGGALAPGCGVPNVHPVSFLFSHPAFSSHPCKVKCSSSGHRTNERPAPTACSLFPNLQDCSISKAEKHEKHPFANFCNNHYFSHKNHMLKSSFWCSPCLKEKSRLTLLNFTQVCSHSVLFPLLIKISKVLAAVGFGGSPEDS